MKLYQCSLNSLNTEQGWENLLYCGIHVQESGEQELKPLRYNPGLKCDPELEAMRPERLNKHTGER